MIARNKNLKQSTTSINEAFGENNRKVDIQNQKKILTVSAEGANETNVIKAVEKAGYKAKELRN